MAEELLLDFFGWTAQQAELLRVGRLAEIDREHLAEEMEDMGRSLQRDQLTDHLQDNPSLKQTIPQAVERTYKYARTGAARETGLAKSTFSEDCPWSFEQALDNEFWPE